QLSIIGTDLEVELIAKNKLDEPFSHPIEFTVAGRKLLDICKALPEQAPIELIYSEQRLTIKSGRSRFNLSTLSASEFP
ncbi:DNA polymerase III subunit beta, partial [Escherichia coli]|nr:DNA polymerase III subunit beta [Escherichia coli]